MRALPGVEAAGSVAFLPLSGWHGPRPFRIEGEAPVEAGNEPEVEVQWIGVGYRDAMKIPLARGTGLRGAGPRGLAPGRARERRVRATVPVRRPLGALGRRLSSGVRSPQSEEPPLREIVGVLGDVRHLGYDRDADPAVYVPFAQTDPAREPRGAHDGRPRGARPALRTAVWAEDPEQPVAYLMPLAELARESMALRRLSALLAGAFAVVALGLAMLGTYGVVAQVVSHGTREIGVRLALGASQSSVVGGVLREALSVAVVGALAGLGVALMVGRLLRGLLVGVAPLDPLTLTLAAAALVLAAGLAAWLPARRAASIDPALVLRQE